MHSLLSAELEPFTYIKGMLSVEEHKKIHEKHIETVTILRQEKTSTRKENNQTV